MLSKALEILSTLTCRRHNRNTSCRGDCRRILRSAATTIRSPRSPKSVPSSIASIEDCCKRGSVKSFVGICLPRRSRTAKFFTPIVRTVIDSRSPPTSSCRSVIKEIAPTESPGCTFRMKEQFGMAS
eukprot:scaffold34_cov260-Pinguiococcus_pyrenoidosus.AAC.28